MRLWPEDRRDVALNGCAIATKGSVDTAFDFSPEEQNRDEPRCQTVGIFPRRLSSKSSRPCPVIWRGLFYVMLIGRCLGATEGETPFDELRRDIGVPKDEL